jgi:hypothetical protein
MAHQIYLVQLRDEACDDAAREDIAELIHRIGGFILMATGSQALIAAFDEQWLGALNRHKAVALCGGLHLDPNGAAAAKLRRLFAANVAAQLATRSPSEAPGSGPRHRALVWHQPALSPPTHADGIRISTTTSTR